MKKVAIIQSNYIPWKGYFDMIAAVDEFILYDDMQYTRRDWRNRNQIKTPQGVQWLTIPVRVKGKYFQKIRETEIEDGDWSSAHWKNLSQNYRRAPYFDEVATWLHPLYTQKLPNTLSDVNRLFLEAINAYLGIRTVIRNSWDYELADGKSERLAHLCAQAGGSVYLSGPAARDYIDEDVFDKLGIAVRWFDYSGYPEYPQLWGAFAHGVTILDLLFNTGKNAPSYMKFTQDDAVTR